VCHDVLNYVTKISNSYKLWGLCLRREFSQIDWQLREQILCNQLKHKNLQSSNIHIPCIPKILYAQQLALTSRIKQKSLEPKIRKHKLQSLKYHDKDYIYKQINITVLGDPGVGRTSFILHEIRFQNSEILPLCPPAHSTGRIWRAATFLPSGCAYYCRISEPNNDEKSINLSLRNCDVVVLVYDMSNPSNDYSYWINKIGSIPCYVVGLKFDMAEFLSKSQIPTPLNEIGHLKMSILNESQLFFCRLILALLKKTDNFEY